MEVERTSRRDGAQARRWVVCGHRLVSEDGEEVHVVGGAFRSCCRRPSLNKTGLGSTKIA